MIVVLRKYRRLLPGERRLLREAVRALARARLTLFFPFARLAARLGTAGAVSPEDALPAEQAELVAAIARAIDRAAPYLPWQCRCLVRAAAGKWMCDRRGLATTVYLGVGKQEADQAELAAHAWLRAGDTLLIGAEEAGSFQTITTFS